MRLRQCLKYAGAMVAVSGVLLGVGATPASAHLTRYNINNGGVITMGWVEVSANHLQITVCDTRSDNIGVYANYILSNGSTGVVSDGDGNGGNCGRANVGTPIASYEGVARDGHSTGWHAT